MTCRFFKYAYCSYKMIRLPKYYFLSCSKLWFSFALVSNCLWAVVFVSFKFCDYLYSMMIFPTLVILFRDSVRRKVKMVSGSQKIYFSWVWGVYWKIRQTHSDVFAKSLFMSSPSILLSGRTEEEEEEKQKITHTQKTTTNKQTNKQKQQTNKNNKNKIK